MLTCRYTMDPEPGRAARHRRRADLVGAVRLPGGAHRGAGTEVVTDLLVLRRRDPGRAADPRGGTGGGRQVDGHQLPVNE